MSDTTTTRPNLNHLPSDFLDDLTTDDVARIADSFGIHAWELLHHFEQRSIGGTN